MINGGGAQGHAHLMATVEANADAGDGLPERALERGLRVVAKGAQKIGGILEN
ncbi:hypothetical protein ABO01nite_22130 [Asaia bogorensis NBRC 16594]|uniref:Uncharacterized protein n=1 Tax=Asaia bogorensis NBRC 16594 TaxID=1231624 RepID=A0AAN4U359_9PROT|nr:hypothetical protein ABO01nite_22130 [Asaia bogorensis NBRC 16594]